MDVVQAALQDLERLSDPELPEGERKLRLLALKERFRIENVYEQAKQMADGRRVGNAGGDSRTFGTAGARSRRNGTAGTGTAGGVEDYRKMKTAICR